MMMEKLLIEEQIIKRWHQKTITRPSPIEIHPNYSKLYIRYKICYPNLRFILSLGKQLVRDCNAKL